MHPTGLGCIKVQLRGKMALGWLTDVTIQFAVVFASGAPVFFLSLDSGKSYLAHIPSLLSKDILVGKALQRVFSGLYAAPIREFTKWVGTLSSHSTKCRLDYASPMRGELIGYLSDLTPPH